MHRFISIFRTEDGQNRLLTFALICCLFGLSGLCNGMIDVLNKHFKDSLQLSDSQSALVQGAWYGAYFLMAFPGGFVARRFGYRGGILTGRTIILAGSLLFIPVTRMTGGNLMVYAAFLATLFAVGAGFTFLETVANPYATVLGPPDAASSRINLAQSFNAIGWIIGPILGGKFTLAATGGQGAASNASLHIPYLVVAGLVLILLVVFSFAPVPNLQAMEETHQTACGRQQRRPLTGERHFVLGIGAQFLYVAGQCGIFAFFITYILDPDLTPALPLWAAENLPESLRHLVAGQWHITKAFSPILLSTAFLLFALGRFSGSAIQRFCRPHAVLGTYGLINVILMLIVLAGCGWLSVIALMVSFFFMSIMYPTIFALGIRGLGSNTKLAASFMVTTIIGGAIMPYCMGKVIDRFGMSPSFLIPAACFAYIAFYGFTWRKFFVHDTEGDDNSPVAAGH